MHPCVSVLRAFFVSTIVAAAAAARSASLIITSFSTSAAHPHPPLMRHATYTAVSVAPHLTPVSLDDSVLFMTGNQLHYSNKVTFAPPH